MFDQNLMVQGFGPSQTGQDLQALSKALEAGYQTGTAVTGGSALRVQSLESSLKALTFSEKHIRFWKKIPKSPAYSTVEEYNQLTSYGTNASPWLREGELPQSNDAAFRRQTQLVKYMGTVREVTHVASLISPAHGNNIALTTQTGILWLLQQVERALFAGDSSLAFSGESEQWDGLDALIDPTSLLDLEGTSLTEAVIEDASNTILENYGVPTDMYLSLNASKDLTKTLYPRTRLSLPAPVDGVIGNPVRAMETTSGLVELNPDIFIQRSPSPAAAATSPSAPATPASITAGAATGSTGNHNKGAPTGVTSYFAYVVTACNRFGESAPTAVMGGAVALTNTEKNNGNFLPLTITNPAVIGAFAPEYFCIYRTVASTVNAVPASLSSYSLIAKVPAASQAANGTTTFNDVNLYLPFTSTAYLGQLDESVLTFRQLLPMLKMDLAITSPSYRFMLMLYGTPILFAPKKWIRLINVGNLS